VRRLPNRPAVAKAFRKSATRRTLVTDLMQAPQPVRMCEPSNAPRWCQTYGLFNV